MLKGLSHPSNSTIFALFLTLLILSYSLPNPASGQTVSFANLQQRLRLGCGFLEKLYNSTLQIVRSGPGSVEVHGYSTYYIASDNLLAIGALQACGSTGVSMSRNINKSISPCCSDGHDLKHESLLGTRIPLPIHAYNTYIVAYSAPRPIALLFNNITAVQAHGNYTVSWDVANATGILQHTAYADVAAYTSLELALEGNRTGAENELNTLILMFDGRGMVDEPYKAGSPSEHGIYQTYKTALYIYALRQAGEHIPYGLDGTLLRTQGLDGGFHTGYDSNGTYAGTQENAETAAIVILALNALTQCPKCIPFWPFPSWIIALWIGLAIASVTMVAIILYRELQKKSPV